MTRAEPQPASEADTRILSDYARREFAADRWPLSPSLRPVCAIMEKPDPTPKPEPPSAPKPGSSRAGGWRGSGGDDTRTQTALPRSA